MVTCNEACPSFSAIESKGPLLHSNHVYTVHIHYTYVSIRQVECSSRPACDRIAWEVAKQENSSNSRTGTTFLIK